MVTAHNAAKYEELREQFLQAVADYDHCYSLHIGKTARFEERLLSRGRYDVPCFTEWPFLSSWRRCAVLAPCTGDSEEPYSRLKKLGATAWVFLPDEYRTAVLGWCYKNEDALWNQYYQGWLWLLWLVDFHENYGREGPGPSQVELEPFAASVNLIREWRLDTDQPAIPDWIVRGAEKPLTDPEPNGHTRPAYQRDHLWLDWRIKEKMGPAKIRDRWDNLSEEERKRKSPRAWEKVGGISGMEKKAGYEIVKSALKKAKKERSLQELSPQSPV